MRLHAATDRNRRPLDFSMTVGQISDYPGAAVLPDGLPPARWMLADRDYDADWFRPALKGEREQTLYSGTEIPQETGRNTL